MSGENQPNQTVIDSNNPAVSPKKPESASNDDNNNNNLSPVDTVLARLTMGEVGVNNESTVNDGNDPEPNPRQQLNNQNGDNDPRDNVVSQLLKPFRHDPLRTERDIDKITEAMANGDINLLLEEMDKTTEAGIQRSLKSVLSLIPDIISQAVKQAGEEANSAYNENSYWQQFTQENPDFAGVKLVKEKLLEAINGGAEYEDAASAVKIIFGNLAAKNRNRVFEENDDQDDDNGNSGGFNFQDYLK